MLPFAGLRAEVLAWRSRVAHGWYCEHFDPPLVPCSSTIHYHHSFFVFSALPSPTRVNYVPVVSRKKEKKKRFASEVPK